MLLCYWLIIILHWHRMKILYTYFVTCHKISKVTAEDVSYYSVCLVDITIPKNDVCNCMVTGLEPVDLCWGRWVPWLILQCCVFQAPAPIKQELPEIRDIRDIREGRDGRDNRDRDGREERDIRERRDGDRREGDRRDMRDPRDRRRRSRSRSISPRRPRDMWVDGCLCYCYHFV